MPWLCNLQRGSVQAAADYLKKPATEPIHFKIRIVPVLDPTSLYYYQKSDHLRTNRTKNRNPGHTKTLVCNILRVLTINNLISATHVSFLQEEDYELSQRFAVQGMQ